VGQPEIMDAFRVIRTAGLEDRTGRDRQHPVRTSTRSLLVMDGATVLGLLGEQTLFAAMVRPLAEVALL
jgi:hypothetical protein